MRLRTEHWWDAGRKRAILLGAAADPRLDDPARWDKVFLDFLNTDGNEALLGDVWVIRLHPRSRRQTSWRDHEEWPIVGYGLTCPLETCDAGIHIWDHAYDCDFYKGSDCKIGAERLSCWTWTGSVEAGDLTASPSLHCVKDLGGCGYHGFLQNGVMS